MRKAYLKFTSCDELLRPSDLVVEGCAPNRIHEPFSIATERPGCGAPAEVRSAEDSASLSNRLLDRTALTSLSPVCGNHEGWPIHMRVHEPSARSSRGHRMEPALAPRKNLSSPMGSRCDL